MDERNHFKRIEQARKAFEDSIKVKEQVIQGSLEALVAMGGVIASSIQNGGKLFLCGNGGSAADAQHLAAELLIRLRPHVNRASLPAIFLAMDMSTLTACGNDYGFNDIFARPLAGLGRKGDVLLGLTTSGRSPNILAAFEQAKKMEITTLGFLGCSGQPALSLCDWAFKAPSHVTARIQESHITAGHVIMEMVEDILMDAGVITSSPLV